MDREISRQQQRRNLMRKTLPWFLGLLAFAMLIYGLRFLLKPSVSENSVRVAEVEEGPLESTITASGLVVAKAEQLLPSPIESRVLQILVKPGQQVRAGDAVVLLDTSETRLELENLNRTMEVKRKQREGKQLALEKALIDLDGKRELKVVDLESYRAKVDRFRKLLDSGLVSKEEAYEAELQVKRAEIELAQMKRSGTNLEEAARAEIESIDLEIASLEQEKRQKEQLLSLAGAYAERDGVVTWVVEKEGTSINRGDVLARIADLGGFKVEATVSDVYSPRLLETLPVRVQLDRVVLDGTLETVLPAIEDGTVKLLIQLENPSHPDLRANLRVDAFIVTAMKEHALRVRSGPFANGSGPQDVFVVRDGKAFKTRVELGMSSFDYLEVVRGLSPGDRVIISDMSRYLHLEKVDFR